MALSAGQDSSLRESIMHEPATDILDRWLTNGALGPFIARLNATGVVTDEDRLGLSSTMAEGWDEACESFVRLHGYEGGPIELRAAYFNNVGNIYALYDSDALSAADVDARMQAVAKRNPPLPG